MEFLVYILSVLFYDFIFYVFYFIILYFTCFYCSAWVNPRITEVFCAHWRNNDAPRNVSLWPFVFH